LYWPLTKGTPGAVPVSKHRFSGHTIDDGLELKSQGSLTVLDSLMEQTIPRMAYSVVVINNNHTRIAANVITTNASTII
jgi:hypothetical protein